MQDIDPVELGPDGLPAHPTWSSLQSAIHPDALSSEGRDAAAWALSVLETYLGSSWPRRQFQQQGWTPGCILGFSGWRHELPRLLALAANLTRFGSADGAQPLRRRASDTATLSDWRHLCLQLEVARAASRVGEFRRFEPVIGTSRRFGDVEIAIGGQTLIVEVTSVARADADVQHEAFERRLSWSLLQVELETGVTINTKLMSTAVEPHQVQAWLAQVRTAAEHVARTGVLYHDRRGFARVEISVANKQGLSTPGVGSFRGALHSRDAWLRIRGALRQKGRQTKGAQGVWIRLDAVDGLFSLTDWARRPMRDRTEQISQNLREALDGFEHVEGIVLSSGAGSHWSSDDDPDLRQRADAEGATLLRRPAGPGLVRETVVLPLREAARGVASGWIKAYDQEAQWLSDDLGERGWSLARMRAPQPPGGSSSEIYP